MLGEPLMEPDLIRWRFQRQVVSNNAALRMAMLGRRQEKQQNGPKSLECVGAKTGTASLSPKAPASPMKQIDKRKKKSLVVTSV